MTGLMAARRFICFLMAGETPPRHRRTVEGKLVQKELFAAEELEVRILHPPVTQLPIRQAKSELQDLKSRHQSRRQRRLAALAFGAFTVNLSAHRLGMLPVQSLRQLHQLMLHVENLVGP